MLDFVAREVGCNKAGAVDWCRSKGVFEQPATKPKGNGKEPRIKDGPVKEWKYPLVDGGTVIACRQDYKNAPKRVWRKPKGVKSHPLPRLMRNGRDDDNVIVIPEGEIKVDAIHAAGFNACGWIGGATAVYNTAWEECVFLGKEKQTIVLWPDNDETSRNAMAWLRNYLTKSHRNGLSFTVLAVQIPEGKPPKWDAADDDVTPELIRELVNNAVDASILGEHRDNHKPPEEIAGEAAQFEGPKRVDIEVPWEPVFPRAPVEIPRVIWRDDGRPLMNEGIIACLSGMGAIGKTHIVTDLALCRAGGFDEKPLGHWTIEPGLVLHVHVEDKRPDRMDHFRKWAIARNVMTRDDLEEIEARVRKNYHQIEVGPMIREDRQLIQPEAALEFGMPTLIQPGPLATSIKMFLEDHADQSVFVILDPISKMIGDLPETNEVFTALDAVLGRISYKFPRATFLIIQHVAKTSIGNGGGGKGAYSARGGTNLINFSRWGATIRPATDTERRYLTDLAETDDTITTETILSATVLDASKINGGPAAAWLVAYQDGVFNILCDTKEIKEKSVRNKIDLEPWIIEAMQTAPEEKWSRNKITQKIQSRPGRHRPNDDTLKRALMKLVGEGEVIKSGTRKRMTFHLPDGSELPLVEDTKNV